MSVAGNFVLVACSIALAVDRLELLAVDSLEPADNLELFADTFAVGSFAAAY